MPSVGMIRSTRVFVPTSVAKDVNGTRGYKYSEKMKLSRGGGYRDDWFRLLDDSGERPCDSYYKNRNSIFYHKVVHEQDESMIEFKQERRKLSSSSMESVDNLPGPNKNNNKMYGIVYSRKRRKLSGEDGMFGIKYLRKHTRKSSSVTEMQNRARTSEIGIGEGPELMEDLVLERESRSSEISIGEGPEARSSEISIGEGSEARISEISIGEGPELMEDLVLEKENSISLDRRTILSFVVESSCGSVSPFTYFLTSLLRFMTKSKVRLSLLASFMSSEPISRVFSQQGIQLLQDPISKITWKDNISSSVICQILGTRKFVPIFFVNFMAIPSSFMRLHSTISFRSQYLPDCLVRYLNCLLTKDHEFTYRDDGLSSISAELNVFVIDNVPSESSSVKKRKVDFIMMGASEFSFISPKVQRKRNSLRIGRVKNTLSMDYFLQSDADGYNSFSAPEPKQKQMKLLPKKHSNDMKNLNTSMVELKQNMDAVSCSANVLVIESDKCYREDGAIIMLARSDSKEWALMIRRQGSIYTYEAHGLMRPSTTNRFTHTMIWTGENGWKLEFPDRRDWFVFKELYRECINRNARAPPAKAIPVPSVREVPDYENAIYVPFVQPDAYITVHDDEATRASMRETANYDVDSGDEEWLGKLNNDHDGENSGQLVSVEKFEEVIDAFEKVAFYSLDDAFDENRAASVYPDLGRNVVGHVYQYWLKKRKRMRGPLLKVFQYRSPKKAQPKVLNKRVLRKRQMVKKQNQPGRGKQWCILQDVERDNIRRVEEENMHRAQEEKMQRVQEENMRRDEEADMRRIEELTESANQLLELSVSKRKLAQTLMDNADLAAYRATLAVRIAEAAQVAESTEVAASSYLD